MGKSTKQKLEENIKEIKAQSDSLKGRGQLDGLHEIAKQNIHLSEIYKELILAIKSLHTWTIALTVALIVLTCILVIIGVISVWGNVTITIIHK